MKQLLGTKTQVQEGFVGELPTHYVTGHGVGRLVRRVFVGSQAGKRPQGEIQSTSWIKPLKEAVPKSGELGDDDLPLLSGSRFIDSNPGFPGCGYGKSGEVLMMATNAPSLIEEPCGAPLHDCYAGLDR